jgi:hypothetical protein
LLLYDERGTFDIDIDGPTGIALDAENRIYVCGKNIVARFSPDGNLDRKFETDVEALCISLAADGRFVVIGYEQLAIYEDSGRKCLSIENADRKSRPTSAAFTDKCIYVADAGRRVVKRFDISTDEDPKLLAGKDEARNIPGLIVPSPHLDIAMAPDGLLRVTNPGRHRIEAYTENGDLEWSWGESSITPKGFGGCCNPTDIAVDSRGNVFTAEKGIPRIKRYSEDGEFVGFVAGAESFDKKTSALDLAVDSSGRIIALDLIRRQIRIFVPKAGKQDE